ncbi:MAG: valine--tRNA ligase [Clostridiales bacterium]|nr:valine--tRNA ligase [Clostridiales bacterium]
MESRYNPAEMEDRIYEFWLKNKCFKAEVDHKKTPYTIVMPPPNVTSHLHMGHALDQTLQDILIRFKRMQGYSALWLPGTDHAGIATQIKVEEMLRNEEGITRHDLGRDKFLERVWEWKDKYGDIIVDQVKRLGSSCDWDRLDFTMNPKYAKAVREVFVKLYNQGLIYQGSRIINWCPSCTTALSDAEVDYKEQAGHFWHIKYPIVGEDGYLSIATTRPETLLGDSAVAVNPSDERYKKLVGKMLKLPLVDREIPIIADDYVDSEFGTGAVKITPAHDPNDFEVGQRHNLEQILIMDGNARINENGGKYKGLDRYEARKKIVEDLEREGYLIKIEGHEHNVGQCYRCGTTVEPIISKQWFVDMQPLAKEAVEVVKTEEVKFVPSRFSKTYLNWMENVRDWCISRQLWWGHRIPAFYCQKCGHVEVSMDDVYTCPKCGGEMVQDSDVLDTWFSSALWPFATLGYPEKSEDLDYFYPTDTLVTGYDIIFFWVARMIFSGLHHMKQKPFKNVFIHGLVRDSLGRKMSKSLGNGVNPLDVIEKYGADAMRGALVAGNSPGNDLRFGDEKVEAQRNFANKLWNAARFVMMNKPADFDVAGAKLELKTIEDKWIISLANNLVKEVTENLEKFELGIAYDKIQTFIWDEFCDWYIEMSKGYITTGDTSVFSVLVHVLDIVLKLLHPFMPFITEEIYQSFKPGQSISLKEFPTFNADLVFNEEVEKVDIIKGAIKAIRNSRAEAGVQGNKRAKLFVVTDIEEIFKTDYFATLSYASEVIFAEPTDEGNVIRAISRRVEAFMLQDELVDKAKEKARLDKEREHLLGEIKVFEGKLANKAFVDKAPQKVVEEQKSKLEQAKTLLQTVEEQLKGL